MKKKMRLKSLYAKSSGSRLVICRKYIFFDSLTQNKMPGYLFVTAGFSKENFSTCISSVHISNVSFIFQYH